MPKPPPFDEGSPSVQAHLTLLQSIIQRMATNSASCKAWCITLVSAVLVIVADKGKPQYAFIAAIPVLLFLVLDAYYLALEKMFREAYNNFVKNLHDKKIVADDLFIMDALGELGVKFRKSLGSFSVWPFYGTLLAMIWVSKAVVL